MPGLVVEEACLGGKHDANKRNIIHHVKSGSHHLPVSPIRKIPQPHGGALNSGGTPGNKGGPGASPSELRARLRGSVEERVKIIEEILDDPDTSTSDRIRCVDVLLKYGLGTAHEVGGVDGGPILIAAHAEKAKKQVRERLKRLAAEPRKLPASERPDPAKAVPEPSPPPKKYDPKEVIAVFEDRGTGIKTQEPTEKAEAVTEPDTEDGAPNSCRRRVGQS